VNSDFNSAAILRLQRTHPQIKSQRVLNILAALDEKFQEVPDDTFNLEGLGDAAITEQLEGQVSFQDRRDEKLTEKVAELRAASGDESIGEKDIDQQGLFGATKLHVAVEAGEYEHIVALVEQGADTTIEDNNNMTPYDLAVKHERRFKADTRFAAIRQYLADRPR
jgi:hypothetical protein